jgi:hypothetical protein
LKLGYKDEVKKTLKYALDTYKKYNKTATTISPNGVPYDVFSYAPDTFAFLLRSIRLANFNVSKYKTLLQSEYERFIEAAYDKKTGLIRADRKFSSSKDYSIRKSSVYDNCMLYVIADEMRRLGLKTELNKNKIREKIKKEFWSGDYFYDDITKKNYVAGDAQVFPFFLGVFTDRKMLSKALQSCIAAGLDRPHPLSYTKNAKTKFIPYEFFVAGYQRNTSWMNIGILFTGLMRQVNSKKAKAYKRSIGDMIKKLGTYPEVLEENGKMFKSPFYHCATCMLWASNYLVL